MTADVPTLKLIYPPVYQMNMCYLPLLSKVGLCPALDFIFSHT